jgi:hypothetical protein
VRLVQPGGRVERSAPLGALDEAGGFRPFLARSLEKLGINVEGLFAAD